MAEYTPCLPLVELIEYTYPLEKKKSVSQIRSYRVLQIAPENEQLRHQKHNTKAVCVVVFLAEVSGHPSKVFTKSSTLKLDLDHQVSEVQRKKKKKKSWPIFPQVVPPSPRRVPPSGDTPALNTRPSEQSAALPHLWPFQ